MPPVGADPADVDVRPLDHRPASLRQVSAPAALAAVSALLLPRIKSFFFSLLKRKRVLFLSQKNIMKCFFLNVFPSNS